eukprot:CAMPEP_0204276492 /NCGR_PEP_ID=MMETSP0468-20130131/28221_1 /ASSEMBLY_ACC=CAM_ASM_000383 /TAXON_ID=2969 /ORGANISM="Oxyrrhis marina" /LENGTH=32 /DNA_ID= /DNA_START= /DNA_END= /DNA_ORIENTATION=
MTKRKTWPAGRSNAKPTDPNPPQKIAPTTGLP